MSARIFPSVGRYYKTDTYVERSYSGKRNNLLPVAEGLNATLYIKKKTHHRVVEETLPCVLNRRGELSDKASLPYMSKRHRPEYQILKE